MGLSPLPVVVLVESDPLVRYGYSVLVGDWGYEVIAGASTGEAADAVAATGRSVGALVLGHDVAMAEGGLSAAAALARQAGGVPVAIIAGRLQREILERATSLHFIILSEAAEPDLLQEWLRASLTMPVAIDQLRGQPAA
jgi:DNA-binding NarL/FixJ family response regulator